MPLTGWGVTAPLNETPSITEQQSALQLTQTEAKSRPDDKAAGSSAATRAAQGQVARDATAVGAKLFSRHYAACHGAQGDGQGLASDYLFPRPRNIRKGRFRLVSTKNNVPTREDLQAVLLCGMPGSSMQSWAHLSKQTGTHSSTK